MIRHERFEKILSVLEAEQKVDAQSLSQQISASEATIRRDISALAAMGKLQKVHGGAIPLNRRLAVQERIGVNQQEKQVIADKAVRWIKHDMLILIDGGTTNQLIARRIPSTTRATIITNSPGVLQSLSHLTEAKLILLGGEYFSKQDVLYGPQALDYLKKVHADLYLMGVCSLHKDYGLTTGSEEEALMKEKMMNSASATFALADSAKLQQVEHYHICKLETLHTLITELPPDDERLGSFKDQIENIF